MNQKEYELIAENLRELKISFVNVNGGDAQYNKGKYDAWYILVNQLTNDLERNYPRTFDRDKFIGACGL